MKSNKFRRILIPMLLLICLFSKALSGTDQKKQDPYSGLKRMIDSKTFRFHAQSATSMKGKTIQLTSEYFLQVNKDSLQVDLPYYGRAYSAGYPGTDPAFQFSSNEFTYVADTVKKGGWNITIKPIKESKVSVIYLSVGAGGYCTVRINSNNRDPISYYGTITEYSAR